MKICMSEKMKTTANRSSDAAAAQSLLFCPSSREQEGRLGARVRLGRRLTKTPKNQWLFDGLLLKLIQIFPNKPRDEKYREQKRSFLHGKMVSL